MSNIKKGKSKANSKPPIKKSKSGKKKVSFGDFFKAKPNGLRALKDAVTSEASRAYRPSLTKTKRALVSTVANDETGSDDDDSQDDTKSSVKSDSSSEPEVSANGQMYHILHTQIDS